MKILHINTGQHGGAPWCAMRINKSLCEQGVESKMLFAEGNALPKDTDGAIAIPDKEFWYSNPVLSKVKHLLMRLPWFYDQEKVQQKIDKANSTQIKKLYVHHPYSNYKNIAHHPLVKWADVIHLHWVTHFVDYPTFFKEVYKPIVWTLHDNFPAVGIQHFYSKFTPLPHEFEDVDKLCIQIKRKGLSYVKNLHVVAISEQMKKVCENSSVVSEYPLHLIHNGVDTDIFKRVYTDRESVISKYARIDFYITSKTKVFIFVACEIWDKNKGLDRVLNAIEKINYEDKLLIIVGNNCHDVTVEASFKTIVTGLITEQRELAKLYSIADFFISASYEETYGQTITEAMACGCPVIATPTGVAPEIINNFNGVLCDDFTYEDIKNGIDKALLVQYDSEEIRKYVCDNFAYSIIAKYYISLYEQLMK